MKLEDDDGDNCGVDDCDTLPSDDAAPTEVCDYLPLNCSPCFAYTLQLVVTDGLEKDS